MAHLWLRTQGPGLAVLPLAEGAYLLTGDPARPVVRHDGDPPPGAAVLRHVVDQWLLAAAEGAPVRLNGLPLALGLRVLMDKDELCIGRGGRLWFSTERLAVVEPFPGAAQPVFCPRCKTEIKKGVPAVRCPSCGIWHHEDGDLKCWTYAPRCAICDQPTELGQSYRWTPEGL